MNKRLLSIASCLLSISEVTLGAIVYSGSQNVTLALKPRSPMSAMTSQTIHLAGMGDNWADFRVELWLDMSMPGDMTMAMATRLAIYAPKTNMGMGGVLGSGRYASNLAMGAMIGSAPSLVDASDGAMGDTIGLPPSFLDWAYLYGSGADGGSAEFGEDGGYIGLLTAMGNACWLHMARQRHPGTNKHSVTFDGWAYEDQPWVPIGAGAVRTQDGQGPAAGFVIGGGWIDSPMGAYRPGPALSGKANFGFAARYEKGTNVPRGNTEFQFKAGHVNFHSGSYEWLVFGQNGSDAQFKGTGTINGSGDYKFMLWAGDGTPDTFHIKIWSEGSDGAEVVVYDNGSSQAIGGGSIVIHTK